MAVKNKPTRITNSEHIWSSYTITMPDGATIEDALKTDWWTHVAKKFRLFDRICIIADDESFVAELLVIVAGENYIRVAEQWRWERAAKAPTPASAEGEASEVVDANAVDDEGGPPVPAVAYVKRRGPTLNWCVMRASDDEPLKERLPSKEAAEQWLRDYVKTIS